MISILMTYFTILRPWMHLCAIFYNNQSIYTPTRMHAHTNTHTRTRTHTNNIDFHRNTLQSIKYTEST